LIIEEWMVLLQQTGKEHETSGALRVGETCVEEGTGVVDGFNGPGLRVEGKPVVQDGCDALLGREIQIVLGGEANAQEIGMVTVIGGLSQDGCDGFCAFGEKALCPTKRDVQYNLTPYRIHT